MSQPLILTEKLRRPEATGLGRERLESRLLDEVPGSRLDLVIGPPGSGKTTLLARVSAASPLPVAWYRLTPDDSSESVLVAHLGHSLQLALQTPIDGSSLRALLESVERCAGQRAMVVLDDAHEVVGGAAERALERFVALRPSSLRVLIGSRRQPDLNIPRLSLSGQLNEIGSDDLRFRSWEVEELFITVFRAPLPPEAAAALTRRTGGWAAGLQLFHLATRGRSGPDRQRAVNELSGRSKLLRSYLARNVLADLPENRRQFLLKTSTLGLLTGALCDELLETTGSGRILDELEQQQLFTSSDDDGETFRYHEVLRAHLEWALVEEVGKDKARGWYSRSAELLEGTSNYPAAIRAHAKAEDWGAVARLLQSHPTHPADGAGMELLLPTQVVQDDPWLSLAEARRQLRRGSLAAAASAFQQAESLLDEPAFRDSCRLERSVALMWTAGTAARSSWPGELRVLAGHWSDPLRSATRRIGGVPEMPCQDGEANGRLLGSGLSLLLSGDLALARLKLGVIEEHSVDPTHRLLSKLAIAGIDILTGAGDDPPALLGSIALEAEFAGLPWVERLSRGFAGAVLVAQGAPSWRAAACQEVLIECEAAGDDWGAALLQLAIAIANRTTSPAVSLEQFADAGVRFRRLDAQVPAVWCDAIRACTLAETASPGASDAVQRAAADARSLGVTAAEALVMGAKAAQHVCPSGAAGGIAEVEVCDAALSVRCFGGFELELGATPIDLTPLRPQARTVLRLLGMVGGTELHAEYLVDALWPGAEFGIGTRRLQVAISSVRRLFEQRGLAGAEWILRRDNSYRLRVAPDSPDVRLFEQLLRRAASAGFHGEINESIEVRQRALALYRGDLLPEEGNAEYVLVERERLRMAAARAASALAVDCRTLGQIEAAVDSATMSVSLDRFSDAAWTLLAELHERRDDPTAASRIRRDHARVRAELEPHIR